MEETEDEFSNLQAKLRSLALLYRELKHRHDPTMDADDRIHKLIYSQRKTSIFNRDPDMQNEFYESFYDKLGDLPQSPSIPLYPDSLLDQFHQLSYEISPQVLREKLADHFKNRISYYQQLIYKYLLNWAFRTEFYQYDCSNDELKNFKVLLNDSIERYERLKDDEDYLKANKKPIPKTNEGTNLYLMAESVNYCSIARDDLEVYIENCSDLNRKGRKFINFLLKLKWMPMSKRYEVWEKTVEAFKDLKVKSVERMKTVIGHELTHVYSFLKGFKKKMRLEEVPGQEEEVEMPPTLINDIKQLQGIVMSISKEFGVKGEMELDDGHSLAYQVTHLFPELFELQKQKLEYAEYGNLASKKSLQKKLQNLQMMKSHRLTSIRKSSSYSEADIPVLNFFEVSSLKKSDWLDKNTFKPFLHDWERKQNIRLHKLQNLNTHLIECFKFLDIQDMTASNSTLEGISFKYQNMARKTENSTENDPNDSRKSKKYFSILLAENITKVQTSSVKLPSQIIKTLYALVLLKNRKLKSRLIDLLNVFRSIERRLVLDLYDKDMRENLLEFKISQNCKLSSRRDEIVEMNDEVYVKDCFDEYIVYDCVEGDFVEVKEKLIRLGSFYIEKYENVLGSDFPEVDYDYLVCDLLDFECKFQFAKYRLVKILLYFYSNTIEKNDQAALANHILNILSMRPRLSLKNSYFYESYFAHIQSLNSQEAFLTAIMQTYPQGTSIVSPLPFSLMDLFRSFTTILTSFSSFYNIESPKFTSLLEHSIWDEAYSQWKDNLRNSNCYFDAGILLDMPDFVLKTITRQIKDYNLGSINLYPKIDREETEPYELGLCCNYFSAWELRVKLENYIEECSVLTKLYQKQCEFVGKDLYTVEAIDWGPSGKMLPEVDEGPGTHSLLDLAIFEIDKSLKAFMNFSDLDCLKYILMSWGLEELFAVTRYQLMHTQALTVAVQINQLIFDPQMRNLCELVCAYNYEYIPNNYYLPWPEIIKKNGLTDNVFSAEKKKILGKVWKNICSLQQIKARNRGQCAERVKILSHLHGKGKKDVELAQLTRRVRVKVLTEYIFEVLKEIYPYAFKVQIIYLIEDYKRIIQILPLSLQKELFKGDYFWDNDKSMLNLLCVPTTEQILDFPAKSIDDLSTHTREIDKSRSIFYYKHYWNFSSDLMKIVQMLGSLVHCMQIRVFLNFLGVPSVETIDFYESITAGEVFWSNSHDNFVQTPETMIEDQISDAFSILKSFNTSLQSIEKEERTSFLVLQARQAFNVLSITLFSTYHYLLQNNRLENASHLKEVEALIFRYKVLPSPSHKNYVILLENTEIMREIVFDKIYSQTNLTRKLKESDLPGNMIYDVKAPNAKIYEFEGLLKTLWIEELDWALLDLSASERNRGLSITTAIQLKIESHLRNIQNRTQIQEIRSIIEFLKPEIRLWRLKSNFFACWDHDYETTMQKYKEIIEDKADKLISGIVKQKDIAKMQAELDMLKEFFLKEIYEASIDYLEKEINAINSATTTTESYGVVSLKGVGSEFQRKLFLLNNFLSVLRNRGTIVQAPGGKAFVYTMKDLAGITKRFADQTIRYKENEYKDGPDKIMNQLDILKEKIVARHKLLLGQKKRKEELEVEVKNMVNAKLTQKGAQIMYEMDVSQRQLKEIKENTEELAKQVRNKVVKEYEQQLEEKKVKLGKLREEFSKFQGQISVDFKKTIEGSKTTALSEMKKFSNFSDKTDENQKKKEEISRTSTVVKLQEILRKLREWYQWTRMKEMQKFEKYLNELKEQLTSNQYLEEQLNESKDRENTLKKELNFTQQALQFTERLAAKLQQQIRDMKIQQQALQSFKVNNSKRLADLQQKVKNMKNLSTIDNRKLTSERIKQDRTLGTLKIAELSPIDQYKSFHNQFSREIDKLRKSIKSEKKILKTCHEQIKLTRGEIEETEMYEEEQWKRKYLELLKSNKLDQSAERIYNFTPDLSLAKGKIELHSYSTPQRMPPNSRYF